MDNQNRASKNAGKNYLTFQLLDDISDNEKNVQLNGVETANELWNLPDKVREWDSEKLERMERAWSKSLI